MFTIYCAEQLIKQFKHLTPGQIEMIKEIMEVIKIYFTIPLTFINSLIYINNRYRYYYCINNNDNILDSKKIAASPLLKWRFSIE